MLCIPIYTNYCAAGLFTNKVIAVNFTICSLNNHDKMRLNFGKSTIWAHLTHEIFKAATKFEILNSGLNVV